MSKHILFTQLATVAMVCAVLLPSTGLQQQALRVWQESATVLRKEAAECSAAHPRKKSGKRVRYATVYDGLTPNILLF